MNVWDEIRNELRKISTSLEEYKNEFNSFNKDNQFELRQTYKRQTRLKVVKGQGQNINLDKVVNTAIKKLEKQYETAAFKVEDIKDSHRSYYKFADKPDGKILFTIDCWIIYSFNENWDTLIPNN